MLEVKFYDTYYFCNMIRTIMVDPIPFLRNLDDFYGSDNIFYLIHPFSKYSAFHRFIEFIVSETYYEQLLDIDLDKKRKLIRDFKDMPSLSPLLRTKPDKLPMEVGLDFYSISHLSFLEYLTSNDKDFFSCNEEDLHLYMEELQDSGAYYELIEQIVKEVFHITFQNRELMMLFNQLIAGSLEYRNEFPPPEEFKKFFNKHGKLKRCSIPKWVKRAVFFRDKGRCILCNKDLTGIININNIENYDHIVPLAMYGLNDVSNIQLLCKECNQIEKKDKSVVTSAKYHSWYEYD